MWLHTLGVFAHCTLGYARFLFTLEGGQNWVMGLKSLSAHSKVDGEASLNGNSTFFRSSKRSKWLRFPEAYHAGSMTLVYPAHRSSSTSLSTTSVPKLSRQSKTHKLGKHLTASNLQNNRNT